MSLNLGFSDDNGTHMRSMRLLLAPFIALIGLGAYSARAQTVSDQPAQPATGQQPSNPPASPPPGVELLLTPYLWGSWMNVGINPSNPRVPSASGTVDFDQILNHLTWVPFMGEAEVRDGPYGVLLDYMHVPLKAGINTRNIEFGGGAAGVTMDTGTAMFFYRPIAQPDQYLDVGLGVRAWGIDGDLSLNQGLHSAFSISRGTAWADPLIGGRYHHSLWSGFGATVYADVGGFGLGAHVDWQVIGTIDYALTSCVDLHAGFRSMNFTYSFPRAGANVSMNGPLLAATFRF